MGRRGKEQQAEHPDYQPERGRSRQRRPPGMLPCTLTYLPPGGLVLHHGSRIHGQPWCRRSASQVSPSGGFTYRSGPGPGRSRGSLAGTAGRGPVPAAGSARGEADQASRQRSRRLLCEAPEYLSARGASSRRQQARRLSLARTVPPVAGSCSACTGTAHRAGTSGISYGPQVRTSNTSRSSPPLSAR